MTEPISNGLSTKVPYIERPHYIIWLEAFCDRVWVHVDVFKWTPEIKRQYQLDFKLIPGPLYALNVEPGMAKRAKFILLTGGWKFYSSTEYGDVYRRP